MVGYNPEFLGPGINLPLPSFSPSLVGNVLNKPELRDGIYADYVHFTLVMNRVKRSPILGAWLRYPPYSSTPLIRNPSDSKIILLQENQPKGVRGNNS